MAIARKPVRSGPQAGGVDVEALINKGGSAPTREPSKAETTPVVLRLPTELLEQVDSLLKARPVRIPRHTWILEAVYQKMKQESEAPHE
jgi:hypothetical protein